MSLPPTHAIVVVPARDEERLIARCIESLVHSREDAARVHPEVAVRMVVVADSCVDRTESIVSDRAGSGVELMRVRAGRVGVARSHGIATALGDLPEGVELERVWIANTDGDSAVPENWLSHQIELAASGVDVMVGTVRPDPNDLTAAQNRAWRRSHAAGRPNGHVHGANLGVRASAYETAGGFDPVAEHEDNLLVDRLRDISAIVASDEAEVLTSGRFEGRTPGGYAGHLRLSLPNDDDALDSEVAS